MATNILELEKPIDYLVAIAHEALSLWGYSSTNLKLIKMRENTIFRTILPNGKIAALRIHRHGYHTSAALTSELKWMEALKKEGIKVPNVIKLPTGNLFAKVKAIPDTLQVDMLEWLPGNSLGSLEEGLNPSIINTGEIFENIGALIARLHNHSSMWRLPTGFTRHKWDRNGLTGEEPLWGKFWELPELNKDEKKLILKTHEVTRKDLKSIGKPRSLYGLIHADLNLDNMLFYGSQISAIDFDDCGFGWHLFDIATASISFDGHENINKTTQSVIKGYRTLRDLSDQTIQQMPLFCVLRMLMYLGWIHTRKETEMAQKEGAKVIALACNLAENYLTLSYSRNEKSI